jgi:hypothetical protein
LYQFGKPINGERRKCHCNDFALATMNFRYENGDQIMFKTDFYFVKNENHCRVIESDTIYDAKPMLLHSICVKDPKVSLLI